MSLRPSVPIWCAEIDLYEEVLRLWGMEKVTATLPGGRGRIGGRTTDQIRAARIGETLRACGLNETMTYSFCPADDLSKLLMNEEGRGESVELLNPMSSEQKCHASLDTTRSIA